MLSAVDAGVIVGVDVLSAGDAGVTVGVDVL